MNYDQRLNKDKTSYPKIFKNTYWGNGHSDGDEEVMKNRNDFIEEFNIQRVAKKYLIKQKHLPKRYKDYMKAGYDHNEIYIDKDKKNLIFITSPYVDNFDKLSEYGFERYKCLYGGAFTFIKVVPLH